jgi:hypothetical protein
MEDAHRRHCAAPVGCSCGRELMKCRARIVPQCQLRRHDVAEYVGAAEKQGDKFALHAEITKYNCSLAGAIVKVTALPC